MIEFEFREHRRDDFLTKIMPVNYDPAAECPRFMDFLDQTFAGSVALELYVQRICGYFLTGDTTEQAWWMFYGPTNSGKSTFVRILHGIMGDYALALPEGYFLIDNSTDFVTAQLAGVRLATCVETNEGRRLNVARIKTLTGEDLITAAFKYENHFTFRSQCKLVLVTNYPPRVPAGDDALWRRLKVVPFTQPVKKAIKGLSEILVRDESSGILNWMLQGCKDWMNQGLEEPQEVTAAIKEYRRAEDVVDDFLTEYSVVEASAEETKNELSSAFAEFCRNNGFRPWSTTKLTQELQRFRITASDDKRHYIGLRLRQVVAV
jgi:putative DNA primase/helicase